MNRAPLKIRVLVMYEATMEYLRKNLPIAMLVAGCFTVGYAVKNTEDIKDREAAHAELREQQSMLSASCDARIVQNDQLTQGRMTERDSLLSDQTQRIADLEFLLREMAQRQEYNHNLTEQQIVELKKLTNDAKESIQKEATSDRQTINNEVGAKK